MSQLLLRLLRSSPSSPAATAFGLKCVSHWFVVGDNALAWSEASQLYGVLLGFVTDERPKVAVLLIGFSFFYLFRYKLCDFPVYSVIFLNGVVDGNGKRMRIRCTMKIGS